MDRKTQYRDRETKRQGEGKRERQRQRHGGKRRGASHRFRHLTGSPVKKSLVIVGPKPVDESLALEYMYIVTQADQPGWVKIGKIIYYVLYVGADFSLF